MELAAELASYRNPQLPAGPAEELAFDPPPQPYFFVDSGAGPPAQRELFRAARAPELAAELAFQIPTTSRRARRGASF